MLKCLLCLQQSRNQIRLSSKKGKDLNCSVIIAQHFWFKPENKPTECVCLSCWNVLQAFHELYKNVAKAHNYLECEVPNVAELLEPEVKLELDNLELLPKVEVHETVIADNQLYFVGQNSIEPLTTREPTEDLKTIANLNPLCTNNSSDDDSETEMPLAKLKFNHAQKTEEVLNCKFDLNDEGTKFHSHQIETTQSIIKNNVDSDFSLPSNGKDSAALSDKSNSDMDSDYEPLEEDTRRTNKKAKKCTKAHDENIAKLFENLECLKCKLSFEKFSDLSQHAETAHRRPPTVNCCGRTFQRSNTLSNHALFHFNPKHVKCSYCQRIFKTNSLLEQHLETAHQCNLCSEALPSKNELVHHKLKVHSIELVCEFACETCDKKFSKKCHLSEHKRLVHGEKAFCHECGAVLSSKRSLYRHMRMHRKQPIAPRDPFECDICGKLIKYRNNLNSHKKYVHGKRYECECSICKKVFASQNSLDMHIRRMHESIRKFPCTMCEKVLKSERELKGHINIHTKEKEYVCEICAKVFYRKTSLTKHIEKMHSNDARMRYQCQICEAWLHSAFYLKKHIKRIHEKSDQKIPCPFCSKKSVNVIALNTHIERNHGSKAAKSFREANKNIPI